MLFLNFTIYAKHIFYNICFYKIANILIIIHFRRKCVNFKFKSHPSYKTKIIIITRAIIRNNLMRKLMNSQFTI